MNAQRNHTHRHPLNLRRSVLSAAVLAALLAGTPALAQEAAAEDDSSDSSESDGRDSKKLETIEVTAQGRTEDILDVPYNISAVSGTTIENANILDNAELFRSIPGVAVVDRGARNSSVTNSIRIRGLNVDSSALGDYAVSAASTVATYVGMTPIFANFLLSDLERVEVLRGPQGTLYGSGAIGGAVRYIPRAPDLERFGGRVSLSGSSVDTSDGIGFSGTATLNFPIADTLALRVTGTYNDYPGITDYVNLYQLDGNGIPLAPNGVLEPDAAYRKKEDADDVQQSFGRAALLWVPTDNIDLTLSYMGQSDDFGGRRATTLGSDGNGRPYGDSEIGSIQLEPAERTVDLIALEANIDFGFATLTSSTSDYDHSGDITSENTGFYAQNNWLAAFYYNYPRPMASAVRTYSDEGFVQEFRLASNDGGVVDYVVGAFYFDQELRSSQDSFLRGFKNWWDAAYPQFASAVISDQDYLYRQSEDFTSTALYGELTWYATDTLQFTGGVRGFRDESDTRVYQETGLYDSFFEASNSTGSESETRSIFKGNVSWAFTPGHQLYATIAEGYRRGGSNGTPVSGTFAESADWLSYEADTNTDYEIGFKGAFQTLTYNVDLFYIDWKNPQINTATTNWGFFAVQNGEKATSKGLELELNGVVGENFHYGVGYTYIDATLGADTRSADDAYLINTEGARLPGVPRNQFNLSGDYVFQLENAELTLRADGYYQSSTENTLFSRNVFLNRVPAPNPLLGQPKFYYPMDAFSIWNLSASYARNDWIGTLWVKNVFNEEGVTGVYTEAYMGTSPQQNYFGNGSKELIALPRTLGVTLSYRF